MCFSRRITGAINAWRKILAEQPMAPFDFTVSNKKSFQPFHLVREDPSYISISSSNVYIHKFTESKLIKINTKL